jgi:transketolase
MRSSTEPACHDPALVNQLEEVARRVRCHIFRMLDAAREGHLGGPLSAVEMLCALYMHHMHIDPARPEWQARDRFVLSKGHAAVALYATLAEAGYFPHEELLTFRQIGSRLAGHPDMKKTPGVDMSAGSLGIGISAAVGMAVGAKLMVAAPGERAPGRAWRVYCLIGDGESQSGQVWEAAMSAAHYELDNLTVLLDYNKLQVDGEVAGVMSIEPLRAKWEAFGWHVQEIDGHSALAILDALDNACQVRGQPQLIIAHTVKGKGYSGAENVVACHGMTLTHDQCLEALAELGEEVS